jgi:hypothetical protein
MRLFCRGEGCQASIEVGDSVAPFASYTCKLHVGKKSDDKTRFQEVQFDPAIGSGTDPRAYEKGSGFRGRARASNSPRRERSGKGITPRKRFIAKVGPVLVGHENVDKILKILNEDIRDANSGITRKDE